jgi:hypothetical protein
MKGTGLKPEDGTCNESSNRFQVSDMGIDPKKYFYYLAFPLDSNQGICYYSGVDRYMIGNGERHLIRYREFVKEEWI